MKKIGILLCALLWCMQVTPCGLGFFALLNTIKCTTQRFSFFGRVPRERVRLVNFVQDEEDEFVGQESHRNLENAQWHMERFVDFRDFTTDWLTPIQEGELYER